VRLNWDLQKLKSTSAAMAAHNPAHIAHNPAHIAMEARNPAHNPAVAMGAHNPAVGRIIDGTSKAASQMDTVVPRKFLVQLNWDFQN
jgi:hypothetical protein